MEGMTWFVIHGVLLSLLSLDFESKVLEHFLRGVLFENGVGKLRLRQKILHRLTEKKQFGDHWGEKRDFSARRWSCWRGHWVVTTIDHAAVFSCKTCQPVKVVMLRGAEPCRGIWFWRGWRCSKGLRWSWGNAAEESESSPLCKVSSEHSWQRSHCFTGCNLDVVKMISGSTILAVGISCFSGFLQKSSISGRSADHPRSQCGHVWRGLWEIHAVIGDILIFLGLLEDEVWRCLRRDILYMCSCCVGCFHECKTLYNILNYISLLVCHQQILV